MSSQTHARLRERSGIGFNGQLHEVAGGWQLLGNGYRVYSPSMMRFHSADALSPFGKGGANAYVYCSGDPLNRVDPTGHHWIGWAAVGGLLAVGAGAATGAALTDDRAVQGVLATVAALSLAGVAVGFAGYTRLGNKMMDKVFVGPRPTASAPPLSPLTVTRLQRPTVSPPPPPPPAAQGSGYSLLRPHAGEAMVRNPSDRTRRSMSAESVDSIDPVAASPGSNTRKSHLQNELMTGRYYTGSEARRRSRLNQQIRGGGSFSSVSTTASDKARKTRAP